MQEQSYRAVVRYHEETKHHYERYARSMGYMDWQNQPNPFRFYENTAVFPLPLLKNDPSLKHRDLYQRTGHIAQPIDTINIAGFLELSLGLSAWKAVGASRWSLRMNPSSGNLHPTEGYVVLPQSESIPAGIYHYNALMHALERRAEIPAVLWQNLKLHFGTDGFLAGLTSIFWRESWKYGERALRYCNHDVGHALAALSMAANLFGWKAIYLNGLCDEAIEAMLGLKRTPYNSQEEEHPDLVVFICSDSRVSIPRNIPDEMIAFFTDITFLGTSTSLSREHVNWEIIYKTAELTRKPTTPDKTYHCGSRHWIGESTDRFSAAEIIRKRRSATAFERNGSMTKSQFLSILDNTLPRNNCAPFDVGLTDSSTHLLLFVHNVRDMEPGLYFFLRSDDDRTAIRRMTHADFRWQPIEYDFPLYLLRAGNFRRDAIMVSCHQEIAGDSCFSLGMISKFREIVAEEPFRYRHLFWETGMIGQVLYLEAEAQGARGTGIGCFFDDAVHAILGLNDNQYQSLYHFTVGVPVEDPRLTTYPPYYHLKDR